MTIWMKSVASLFGALFIFLMFCLIVSSCAAPGVAQSSVPETSDSKALWQLSTSNVVVYRNVDWLNNNVCYSVLDKRNGNVAISCLSLTD